eukprot:12678639-Alexandrium_andersonii.AAC.1
MKPLVRRACDVNVSPLPESTPKLHCLSWFLVHKVAPPRPVSREAFIRCCHGSDPDGDAAQIEGIVFS